MLCLGHLGQELPLQKSDNALERVVLGAYLARRELASSSSLSLSIGVTGVRERMGMTSMVRPCAQFG